ncbi:hypothetical protein SESBI_15704 [Sesbania bispinosa]|nr:hypothetical protein SESBI_15704 [Sesbania bispinosa]
MATAMEQKTHLPSSDNLSQLNASVSNIPRKQIQYKTITQMQKHEPIKQTSTESSSSETLSQIFTLCHQPTKQSTVKN